MLCARVCSWPYGAGGPLQGWDHKMRPLPSVLRDASMVAVGNYASVAARVLRGLIIARILGPADMGILSAVNLVTGLGQYADLGVTNAVGREIPVLSGEGRADAAEEMIWYSIAAKIVGGMLVGSMLLVYALARWTALPPSLRLGLCLGGATLVLTGVAAALQSAGQARRKFAVASRIAVVVASASLVLGVIGAVLWGLNGVILSQLAAAFVSVGYAVTVSRPFASAVFDPVAWRRLIALGVPVALLTFMGFGLENVDQAIILSLLDSRSLGLYTVVLYAGSALSLLPLSVSNVVGPRLLVAYGAKKSDAVIDLMTWRPVLLLSMLMPPVIALAWALAPAAVNLLLPSYGEVIGPLRIYMVGVYFLSVNLGVSASLLAMEKHRLNIPIMLGCICLNVVVDYLLVGIMHLGLEGVATGSLVTYSAYWLLHSGLVRWLREGCLLASLARNFRLIWPGLLLVIAVAVAAAIGRIGRSDAVFDLSLVLVTLVVSGCRYARQREAIWMSSDE